MLNNLNKPSSSCCPYHRRLNVWSSNNIAKDWKKIIRFSLNTIFCLELFIHWLFQHSSIHFWSKLITYLTVSAWNYWKYWKNKLTFKSIYLVYLLTIISCSILHILHTEYLLICSSLPSASTNSFTKPLSSTFLYTTFNNTRKLQLRLRFVSCFLFVLRKFSTHA